MAITDEDSNDLTAELVHITVPVVVPPTVELERAMERVKQQDAEIARLRGLLSSSQEMLAAELLDVEKQRDEALAKLTTHDPFGEVTGLEAKVTRLEGELQNAAEVVETLQAKLAQLSREYNGCFTDLGKWIERAEIAERDLMEANNMLLAQTKRIDNDLIPAINKQGNLLAEAQRQEESAKRRIERLEQDLQRESKRNSELNNYYNQMREDRDRYVDLANRQRRVQGHLVGAIGQLTQFIEPINPISLTVAEQEQRNREEAGGEEIPF